MSAGTPKQAGPAKSPSAVPSKSAGDSTAHSKKKLSQSDRLLRIAEKAELFHTPGKEAWAMVPVNGHRENHKVEEKAFKEWLSEQFYRQAKRAVDPRELQRAIETLAARARYEGPEHAVHVRLAEHDGAVWVDLGDAEWRAVRIDAAGWTLVERPPVKFWRPRGMLALPEPQRGGSLSELKPFVNVQDDEDFTLLKAWLLGALQPSGPYPLLVLHGPQGSAKSTTLRVLRELIDPNETPLRTAPRVERDLFIAASNTWLIAMDNLSEIRPWLSDTLCRIATGGSLSTRKLYTDAEEVSFSVVRPITLNGIEEFVTRPDLLDRSIVIQLPSISDGHRKPEGEFWTEFEQVRPQMLGALLNAVSAAKRNLPRVNTKNLPRMADFARWVMAAEESLQIPKGGFLEAYTRNRSMSDQFALEAHPVGTAVQRLLCDKPTWEGTATDLLAVFGDDAYDDIRAAASWPKDATRLSGALRRLEPNLRAVGINVTFDLTRSRRLIRLTKCDAGDAESTTSSVPPEKKKKSKKKKEGAKARAASVASVTASHVAPGSRGPTKPPTGAADGITPPTRRSKPRDSQ